MTSTRGTLDPYTLLRGIYTSRVKIRPALKRCLFRQVEKVKR